MKGPGSMRSKGAKGVWLGLGLIAVLGGAAWLLAELVEQRFEAGTVYAPYSTRRADPLGAKALLEALDRMPGIEALRNYGRLEKLVGGRGTTLVLVDVKPSAWQDGRRLSGEAVERFAALGGRVVMTLDGQTRGWEKLEEDARRRQLEEERQRVEKMRKRDGAKDGKNGTVEKKDEEKRKRDEMKKERERFIFGGTDSLATVMGVGIQEGQFVLTARGGLELMPGEGSGLEAAMLPRWYSRTTLEFKGAEASRWKVLARLNGKAVVAERRFGQGSVLLCTDSYFLSNEGLWREPAPDFLWWLAGGAETVIFDETHLGTAESPGIMSLVRRFRLHGFFVGGLLLFGLFVWQGAMSLVPSREKEALRRPVSGLGATSGLVSLLRRGIGRKLLMTRCFEAWEKGRAGGSAGSSSTAMQDRIEQARKLAGQGSDDVEGGGGKLAKPEDLRVLYQQICETLHPQRQAGARR